MHGYAYSGALVVLESLRALAHLLASCHANNGLSKIIKTEQTLLRQRRAHTSESKVLGDRPTVSASGADCDDDDGGWL